MATAAENIQTRIENAAIELAAWEATQVSYAEQGRSVQWTAHYQALCQSLETLMKAKAMLAGPGVAVRYGRAS